ncbi:sugar transferase [Psychrosphaera sp. F3M07]|uniref:sugar transferase n=1 Tax=Psychrosphaera sp. F3M07 TaxID=2841560 RepID=UPI001C08FA46|nr:sugar transferase [Psychrosphaera sp. F3M07]MBU2917755.1 sugar transferase [Psychrosphaera sp. F3M07]
MKIKQKKIYIYCSESSLEKIRQTLQPYDVEVIFNEHNLTSFKGKILLHHELSLVSKEERNFLVNATERGAWVEPLVSFLDRVLGYTEVELLQSSYFLHTKAFTILSTKRTQVVKRILDLFFSMILLLLTLPIMIATAIAIKISSEGPIFYSQKRVGLFNKEFKVLKFRSMRTDAESSGAQWAQKNDDRVTQVGHFIRKTRIDELPQLVNVILGEMSLVGPRPEREVFVKDLEKDISYYRFRHSVKPGVTGLAQVSYPYGASLEDAIWKHKYDIYYIKHHRTLFDLYIILKTVKVVLFGMGR